VGAEVALELHEAPDLGPVDPNIGFDIGGGLGDGGQVDAEEFGATLQWRGDRPSVGPLTAGRALPADAAAWLAWSAKPDEAP
jgi:hypothetical protein